MITYENLSINRTTDRTDNHYSDEVKINQRITQNDLINLVKIQLSKKNVVLRVSE